MKEAALLMIDIQNDYFEGGKMRLSGSEEAAVNTQLLLEKFRSKGWPVIYIQHWATRPDATFFLPGTVGAEIYRDISPREDEAIITKNFPNSFKATSLEERLQSLNVTHLVVCGMMTHMCVDATVRAAKDAGYNCTVIGDCCATRELELKGETIAARHVHQSFLAALGNYYASIQTVDEFMKEL